MLPPCVDECWYQWPVIAAKPGLLSTNCTLVMLRRLPYSLEASRYGAAIPYTSAAPHTPCCC